MRPGGYARYMPCASHVTRAKHLVKSLEIVELLDRYGGCSSVVEHWIVAPVVAGSIHVTHPISRKKVVFGVG